MRSFTGVPFVLKELGIQAKGTPSRAGSKLGASVVASEDSELMKKIQKFRTGNGGHVCHSRIWL